MKMTVSRRYQREHAADGFVSPVGSVEPVRSTVSLHLFPVKRAALLGGHQDRADANAAQSVGEIADMPLDPAAAAVMNQKEDRSVVCDPGDRSSDAMSDFLDDARAHPIPQPQGNRQDPLLA
jgi:choline dehydrogenase-like flavoprotein